MKNKLLPQRIGGFLLILLPCLALAFAGMEDVTCLMLLVPAGIWMLFGRTDLFSLGKTETETNMRRNIMDGYIIKSVHGHYEVYHNGRFVCSGDTRGECIEAIEELIAA